MSSPKENMRDQALPLPVFNGKNYHFWSIKMKTYFESQDLWNIVQHGPSYSTEDDRALFIIQQALTDEVFPRICEATTAKEAWDILQVEFKGDPRACAAKRRFYQEEFDRGIKMEAFETCQEYYSKLRLMVSRIRYYGGSVREEDVVRKLMEGLPEDLRLDASAMVGDITSASARELIGSLEASEMMSAIVGYRHITSAWDDY